MKELIEELYLTNRALVADDYDECLEYIDETEVTLDIHGYDSGTEIWDSWVVPQKWSVNHGRIEHGSETLLSYDDHPLHLIAYSDSFEGTVSRETLIEHIHTHPTISHAIPWHFRQSYRPWDSEWGFCASQDFVDSLDQDEYHVSIDTEFTPGEMKVAEHHVHGDRNETILLIAHLDHPGMANDDLSGVAAGIELIQRLRERTELTYSYKLLLVPEMIGSAAYLADTAVDDEEFVYGIFLESVGTDKRHLFQRSFTGETKLDAVTEYVLNDRGEDYEIKEFRESAGDDELIFEGPGFEIPTISLSRYPYREYHTHLDDPSIISEERLEDTVECVLEIIDILERDFVPVREFEGVPSLANPKYDLYLDPGQPALANATEGTENLDFKDRMFRYLEGDHSVFDIATEFGLDYEFVYDYLSEFNEKGLVSRKEDT